MKINVIFQMTLSAALMGVAILLGAFTNFRILGGSVNLVGIVVFLMPLFLSLPFLLITVPTTILIVDFLSGFLYLSWVSMIAYTIGVLIIYFFKIIKLKSLFILSTILVSIVIISAYYFGDKIMFNSGQAVNNMISNIIQFAIILPITWILFFPATILSNLIIK